MWALEWAWQYCRSHSFGRFVGATVLGGLWQLPQFWAVCERSIWAWQTFIWVCAWHIAETNLIGRFVGVRVGGGLWALEWA